MRINDKKFNDLLKEAEYWAIEYPSCGSKGSWDNGYLQAIRDIEKIIKKAVK